MKTVKITIIDDPHYRAWFAVHESYPLMNRSEYNNYTTPIGTRGRTHQIRDIMINDIRRL